jgi:hypothetical protein
VKVMNGDVLLIRTGHLGVFKDTIGRLLRMMPGLGIACRMAAPGARSRRWLRTPTPSK